MNFEMKLPFHVNYFVQLCFVFVSLAIVVREQNCTQCFLYFWVNNKCYYNRLGQILIEVLCRVLQCNKIHYLFILIWKYNIL